MATDIWGIDDGHEDVLGNWRKTGEATRIAILKAMGVDPSNPLKSLRDSVRVLRPGQTFSLPGPSELTLEDGTCLPIEGLLPPDLPFGYHRLRGFDDEIPIEIIVSPGRCYLPANLRAWGWAVQLYSLRSAQSWGMGDLADLRRLARWSAKELGAGILLVNPLQAAAPAIPQNPSPYFPTSRLFLNPLYLRVEEVPGAGGAALDLERLNILGKALNREPRIDRDAVFRLKMEALDLLWPRFQGDQAFDRYCLEQGEALSGFAAFCVLAERYGQKWPRWPAEYRDPHSPAVGVFARENRDRVHFHQWLQWLLDRQLAGAAKELPLMQDLPIGFEPEGADSWVWQEVLASGATVGAPPDEYNTLGQDWGLPPFVPHKLRARAYEPFRRTIRAALSHGGGLRIDHVMGFFRLYWIPSGMGPSAGAYVRYPAEDLLAIVALESHRAKAIIGGEDLGTVEKVVKEQLLSHRILSYRLMWFEKELPATYPRMSLAAVTTHDLPTIAGLWSGFDLEKQHELGLNPNEKGMREIRDRLRSMTGLPGTAKVQDVIVRTHRLLAEVPCVLVTATLEDALAVKERPNMPNTTNEWPNWSIPLPIPLEEIESDPLVRQVAGQLQRKDSGRGRHRGHPRQKAERGGRKGPSFAGRKRSGG
jgi:4-alpha-glucanotransferase